MTTIQHPSLHSKVVGDIQASYKKIQKKNLNKVFGTMPLQRVVKTSTCEPFDYNRDTKVEWATTALDKEQGFNWQLFGSIEGIENKQTGVIEIWDGLGRLCMAQLAEVPQIPVIVHEEGTPGALFVKKQKLRNRALNPEAHFVSYASVIEQGLSVDLKTDKEISAELQALKNIGCRVESGINNYYPKNVNTLVHPKISISALRRSLKLSKNSTKELKAARDMVFGAYPKSDEIGKELFEGCVFLFMSCPKAMQNGTYLSLCEFLRNMNSIPQNKLPFKQLGGNQHNDEARSVALGLWEMWSKDDVSAGHPRTILRRKHIEQLNRQ